MAYRKKTYRKKSYKKRPSKSAPVGFLQKGLALAKSPVFQNVLKLALGLNTETKYIDQAVSNQTIPNGLTLSTIQNIFPLIPQGNTNAQRQGDQFKMTSWNVRGEIFNQAGNLLPTRVRIIIVNWGTTLYSASNIADILQQNNMDSMYTMDPGYPHHILHDRIYDFGIYNATETRTQIRRFNFSYKPRNHIVEYTKGDTLGTQANCLRGFVGLYLLADNFTATFGPSLNVSTRMKYVDN